MNTFKPSGRWYIAALTLLLMLLTWDITSRLQGSQVAIAEQFETTFEKDASRREGMRNLLARDVQSAVQLALYRLPELEQVGSDEDRASILQEAFSRIGFSLRNSRYDFFESMLVQETPQGELLLRGRYPSEAALEGVPVSDTSLFAHVDLENVELFESTSEIYEIESDSLLRIAAQQPVLIHTRLIFEGGDGLSRWFMVNPLVLLICTEPLILLANRWWVVQPHCGSLTWTLERVIVNLFGRCPRGCSIVQRPSSDADWNIELTLALKRRKHYPIVFISLMTRIRRSGYRVLVSRAAGEARSPSF